jgi:GNAT superfamily N-acetyltransferase
MPIHLRAAEPADRAAVVSLCERLADFALPPGRTAHEIAVADLHLIDAQLASPDGAVLFLVADHESSGVIGTLFANTRADYFTGKVAAYVEVLAVSERAAGTGVARQLMAAVEAWARERHCYRVELSVFASNMRARGFYQHLGYRDEFVRCVKEVG